MILMALDYRRGAKVKGLCCEKQTFQSETIEMYNERITNVIDWVEY